MLEYNTVSTNYIVQKSYTTHTHIHRTRTGSQQPAASLLSSVCHRLSMYCTVLYVNREQTTENGMGFVILYCTVHSLTAKPLSLAGPEASKQKPNISICQIERKEERERERGREGKACLLLLVPRKIQSKTQSILYSNTVKVLLHSS